MNRLVTRGVSPSHAREQLALHGHVIVKPGADITLARDGPWTFAEAVLGAPPLLLERQPLKPIPGGTTFASSTGFVPLHTDSQQWLGTIPDVQVLACLHSARKGGVTRLVDGWALLEHLRVEDPQLFHDLFNVERHQRFYFGDVHGPTVCMRGGRFVFTHAPRVEDDVARRLAPHLDVAPVIQVALRRGEVLLVDNHRMLHGRDGFSDTGRHVERLLCWLKEGLPCPPALVSLAREQTWHPDVLADARLQAVMAVMRGVPPGVVAARLGVDEAELYRWRDTALAAAHSALPGNKD